MRKLTTFFTLIVVALLMFCGPGFADTVLTPDSVVFGEDQLKEIVFTEVTGPTDDDTFPDVAWCEAACAASNTPMDKCNTTSNACRPDGFVPKRTVRTIRSRSQIWGSGSSTLICATGRF